MPAILTHYTFAKGCLPPEAEKHPEAFYVGAQGPDPFFFYGMALIKRKGHEEVNRFGSNLHHIDLTEAYGAMLTLALRSADKELLLAYVEGLFCHYALDRSCHPYIFYETGFSADPSQKKHYSFMHMYFETFLDFLIAKQKGTFKRGDKALALPHRDAKAISRLWMAMNQEVTKSPAIGAKTFVRALKDYRFALKFTFSKKGHKKALFAKLFGNPSFPYCMSYPQDLSEYPSVDFLNAQKAEWFHPATGVSHHESFSELESEAALLFGQALPLIAKAEKGQEIQPELASFFAGIDHDGNPVGSEKKHFHSALDGTAL
jgi:hypothetical protein